MEYRRRRRSLSPMTAAAGCKKVVIDSRNNRSDAIAEKEGEVEPRLVIKSNGSCVSAPWTTTETTMVAVSLLFLLPFAVKEHTRRSDL